MSALVVSRATTEFTAIGQTIRGLGDEYLTLGEPGNGPGDAEETPQGDPEDPYEQALREAGLLDEEPEGYYKEWLETPRGRAFRRRRSSTSLVGTTSRHRVSTCSTAWRRSPTGTANRFS